MFARRNAFWSGVNHLIEENVRRQIAPYQRLVKLIDFLGDPFERPELQKTIESSVRTDIHRQEILEMRRTIADELKEEGALKNRRQVLLRLLKRRFGNVPDAVSATIRGTDDPDQLDEWLDQVVTVETLDEIGIGTPV